MIIENMNVIIDHFELNKTILRLTVEILIYFNFNSVELILPGLKLFEVGCKAKYLLSIIINV